MEIVFVNNLGRNTKSNNSRKLKVQATLRTIIFAYYQIFRDDDTNVVPRYAQIDKKNLFDEELLTTSLKMWLDNVTR